MNLKIAIVSIVTFIYGYIQVTAELWKSIGKLNVDYSVLVYQINLQQYFFLYCRHGCYFNSFRIMVWVFLGVALMLFHSNGGDKLLYKTFA